MTAMIVIGGIVVYLAVGLGRVAPLFVTRAVADSIQRYPSLAERPGQIEEWRREEAGSALLIAAGWPFYLLGRFLLGRIAGAAPPTSYELTQRIAELERELGMGRPR
ncbi:hypothetical protein [Streptosporangium sp. NPDC004631]